jgi:hypothetical protein
MSATTCSEFEAINQHTTKHHFPSAFAALDETPHVHFTLTFYVQFILQLLLAHHAVPLRRWAPADATVVRGE